MSARLTVYSKGNKAVPAKYLEINADTPLAVSVFGGVSPHVGGHGVKRAPGERSEPERGGSAGFACGGGAEPH